MMVDDLIAAASDNISICFGMVYIVWLTISVISGLASKLVLSIYSRLQLFLIRYSHKDVFVWVPINRKLLLINYLVFRKVFRVLISLSLFNTTTSNKEYFGLHIVPEEKKGFIIGAGLCGLFSVFIHFGLKYREIIVETIQSISPIEVLSFVSRAYLKTQNV